jgi:ectoine hydroxylase-related dioxygenase (phytanoyl-CoA dioxygenase family)
MTSDAVASFEAPEAFEQTGFRVVKGAIPRDLCRELAAEIVSWVEDPAQTGAPATEYGVLRHDAASHVPELADLIQSGTLSRIAVEALAGRAVRFFQDVVVWKTSGTAEPVHWHQDYAYWPLDRPDGVVLWLALDDADAGNGCLHFIPGTHLLGERRVQGFETEEARGDLGALPVLDVSGREEQVVEVPVQPGDIVLMHPLVWHMSTPNPSARRRIAWATTWIGPDVRWDLERANHPYRYTLTPPDGEPVRGDRFPQFNRTDARASEKR